MAIKARGFETFFKGLLADFTADTRIWPEGVLLIVEDSQQIRFGDGLNVFDDLLPINKENMTPAQHLALLGSTTNLPATPGTFADLAASRTAVEALRAALETRMDLDEAQSDALISHLITSGQMSAT